MKKAWIITLVLFSAGAMSLLSACSNDGGVGNQAPQIPVSCTSGQCLNYPGTTYQYPANTQILFTSRKTDQFYQPYYSYAQTAGTLTTGSGWTAMLKEAMGICDRESWSAGSASCSYYTSGAAEIAFQMDSSTASGVRLMIKAAPQASYYSYYGSSPSLSTFLLGWMTGIWATNPQGYFNPMVLNANIWPVNNNQGFEIRSNGPTVSAASAKLLQLQVATGKVEDNSFSYNLYYNGALAASGTMSRCTNSYYSTCPYVY